MPTRVTYVEMQVPARAAGSASLDGRATIVSVPMSVTGVAPTSVAARRRVGLPALLAPAVPRSVATRAAVGSPRAGSVLTAAPASTGTRAAVGGPVVSSVVPPPVVGVGAAPRSVASRRKVGRPAVKFWGPLMPWKVEPKSVKRRTVV